MQCDKTRNIVHGEAFEDQHEISILGLELKRYTKSIMNV